MSGYDAVVFDSDGVLVTPPARATQLDATRAAFGAVGVANPDREHLTAIADGVTTDGLRAICGAYDLDPATFWDARERHDERSQLRDFRAGTRTRYDDVSVIEPLSQRCGVVSNNHHSTIAFVLDFFDLSYLFETYYGREMTIRSLELKKPSPHYLDRALSDLGTRDALYVGDSESDVVAAHRAGIDSAFLRRLHCRDAVLSAAPTYYADDLHDVAAIVRD